MQRKTRRLIAAVAVIALLAAGGAAFTASITGLDGSNANIGFGSETVTGASATNVAYTLNSTGQDVESVAVTLTGDYSDADNTPTYSFVGSLDDGTGTTGGNPDGSGVVVDAGTCDAGTGSYTTGTPGNTVVTCDFTGGVPVNTANGFQLSVTGGQTQSSNTSVTR